MEPAVGEEMEEVGGRGAMNERRGTRGDSEHAKTTNSNLSTIQEPKQTDQDGYASRTADCSLQRVTAESRDVYSALLSLGCIRLYYIHKI